MLRAPEQARLEGPQPNQRHAEGGGKGRSARRDERGPAAPGLGRIALIASAEVVRVRECDGKVSDRDVCLIAFGEEVEQEVGRVEAAARIESVALGEVMGAAADESEAVERRAAEGDPARVHEEHAVELHEALSAGLMH
eukprot:scaffold33950_cov78-Phaeocystis_antarctica.AAC.4